MKNAWIQLPIIAAGLVGFAQQGFSADSPPEPLGYLTQTIAGGGSLTSPRLSVIAPSLAGAIAWEGLITEVSANDSGPSTIGVSGNPWADDQFNGANGAFYVEILSPSLPGAIFDIVDTAQGANPVASSLVTDRNIGATVKVGDRIRIRPHATLGSLFGEANEAGLLASDDPAAADEVVVYHGNSTTSYFYFTGAEGFPAGWYDSEFALGPGEAAARVVAPGDSVVVKRKAPGALELRISGVAKAGDTALQVGSGTTLLGSPSAGTFTLGASGLFTGDSATGVEASDDPSTADEVTLYSASGARSYFYFSGYPGYPAGWYDSEFALAPGEAENIPVPAGSVLAVSRKGRPAFVWAAPAPQKF